MNTLVRTKSGRFTLEQCKTVEELRSLKNNGLLESVLIPTDELFYEYDKIFLNKKQSALAQNGVASSFSGLCDGKCYRLYSDENKFLCLSKYIDGRLKLMKAFWV